MSHKSWRSSHIEWETVSGLLGIPPAHYEYLGQSNLLRQLEPVAFVTTHFLDFAQQLHAQRPDNGCRFLHVKVDDERGATYRFIPGVATTSLAVGTARRLGVTFEELERKLEQRIADGEAADPPPGTAERDS